MGQPSWREITSVEVPDGVGKIWTPVLDYVAPAKLYKVEVRPAGNPPADQEWQPGGSAGPPVTADGDSSVAPGHSGLVPDCALGALVAKVGGSAADLKVDPAQNPNVTLFGVGRHCVFSVEAAKAGTLYLTVNSAPGDLSKLSGSLKVTIFEAL